MDQQELCKLFQSLDRHLRQGKDNPGFYSDCVSKTLLIFEQIKKPWIKWRRLIEKYLQGAVECFTVPFQSVLPLIATREVTLRKGFAMVPLSKLRTVVTWLFNKMLQSEIQTASKNFCTEDERITDLANLVKVSERYTQGDCVKLLMDTRLVNSRNSFPLISGGKHLLIIGVSLFCST